MKLNRRDFFKALGAGAIVISTPKLLGDMIETELWTPKTISIPKTANLVYGDKFAYDYATKNIRYIGPKSESATVLELHRWLQDESDKIEVRDDELCILDPNPSSRATDQIITLHNDWHIDDHTAQYLRDGSIKQKDAIYCGIQTVGQVEDTSTVFINGRPAIRSGHVNQLVKRPEDGSVTCSVTTPGNYYSTFEIKPQHGVNVAALCEQPDLFYNDPHHDPAFELYRYNVPTPYKPMTTSRGQRLGMKLYERNI